MAEFRKPATNRKHHLAHQESEVGRMRLGLLTFEGDEDARRGQRVIDQRVAKGDAGQRQEGVDRPQSVQLHGRTNLQ